MKKKALVVAFAGGIFFGTIASVIVCAVYLMHRQPVAASHAQSVPIAEAVNDNAQTEPVAHTGIKAVQSDLAPSPVTMTNSATASVSRSYSQSASVSAGSTATTFTPTTTTAAPSNFNDPSTTPAQAQESGAPSQSSVFPIQSGLTPDFVEATSTLAASHQQEQAKVPLAFVDPGAKQLDGQQATALHQLQESFTATVGGPDQNPNDPAYARRWQETQPEADQLYRLWFGAQAAMAQQYKAYMQAQANAQQ